MEGDSKICTTEFIVQVAPQMVCDQKRKEIAKRSEGGITNNVLWRCWKTVIGVLVTKRTDCLVWHSVEERPALNSLLWSTAFWQTIASVVETAPVASGSCLGKGYPPSGKQHLIYSFNLSNFSFQSPDLVMLHSLDSRALVTSQRKMERMTSSLQSFLKPLNTCRSFSSDLSRMDPAVLLPIPGIYGSSCPLPWSPQ